MNRSIERALCLDTNKHFSISKDTKEQKERYQLRLDVQTGIRKFECLECGQTLTVSDSKKDVIHFKHLPKSEDCFLKNGSLIEISSFNEYFAAKESPRHKFLKNEIGRKLQKIEDVSNVRIDDKFIIIDGEKRRPDVYCEYNGLKLAFEIQLSSLSLNYLHSRHEFYKKNGIFLIWILDNFIPEKNTQLVRDIKYLNTYQNFFKLDERNELFRLVCKFKFSHITSRNEVHDKWQIKNVALDELTFDLDNYEVFFINYLKCRENKENEALQNKLRLAEQLELQRKEAALSSAKILSDKIYNELSELQKSENRDFFRVNKQIEGMNELELQVFNIKLELSLEPKFQEWLYRAKKPYSRHFIQFFLQCERIEIDVNLLFNSRSALDLLLNNEYLPTDSFFKELLKRGYQMSEKDEEMCMYFDKKEFIYLHNAAKKLKTPEIIRLYDDKMFKLFFCVESMRTGELLNSKLLNWLAFGNNLIEHYSEYWDYLEKALKHFGVWQRIIDLDKKKSFGDKLFFLKADYPKQKTNFRELFDKIFPELI
jgi:hypothetical protein